MISVLIVDDSALVRQTMISLLPKEDGFDVIVAPNAEIGEKKIEKFHPEVLVLDVEMPGMDGITFLKKIMSEKPMPVLICSGFVSKGSNKALQALEYGAIDIIEKPKIGTRQFLQESKTLLADSIRAAAQARVKIKPVKKVPIGNTPKLSADAVLSLGKEHYLGLTEKVIVIGASTGGTEALQYILERLPDNLPPILIVQHMPEHFTKAFANRLNTQCPPDISEASQQEKLASGKVLIAPGGKHMLLRRKGKDYYAEVRDGALVSRHRPSVDVLFRSAARYGGKNIIGIILTGMGDDGSTGMAEMKQAGAFTIAQDEASCIVYGMPKEAVRKGGVDISLPLEKIPEKIIELCRK